MHKFLKPVTTIASAEKHLSAVSFAVLLRGRYHHPQGNSRSTPWRVTPNISNSKDFNSLLVLDGSDHTLGYLDKEAAGYISPLLRAGFFRNLELKVLNDENADDILCEITLEIEPDKLKEFYASVQLENVTPKVLGFQKASQCQSANDCDLHQAKSAIRLAISKTRTLTSKFVTDFTSKIQKKQKGFKTSSPAITNYFAPQKRFQLLNSNVETNHKPTASFIPIVKWESYLSVTDIFLGLRLVSKTFRDGVDKGLPVDYVLQRRTHHEWLTNLPPIKKGTLGQDDNDKIKALLNELVVATDRFAIIKREIERHPWEGVEQVYGALNHLLQARQGSSRYNQLHHEIFHYFHQLQLSRRKKTKTTDEQERVLTYDFPPGCLVKVSALAGSGKTTLLLELTKRKPSAKFLYLCFNKSVQKEAEGRFPKNVECRTIHSLAFELTKIKPFACESTDDFDAIVNWLIRYHHSGEGEKKNPMNNNEEIEIPKLISKLHLFLNSNEKTSPDDLVMRIWEAMQCKEIPMTYAGVLKQCALLPFKLDYDYILLDEAQDCNPACLQIVLSQSHCRRVVVGDANQAIYGFLGTTNLMKNGLLQGCHRQFMLSKCFRFGPAIACAVTQFLQRIRSANQPMVFLLGMAGTVGKVGRIHAQEDLYSFYKRCLENNREKDTQIAFLSRTNAQLLEQAVDVINHSASHVKLGFIGGIKSARVEDLWDVVHFVNHEKTKNSFFTKFCDLESLKKACSARGLQEELSAINAFTKWGLDKTVRIVETLERSKKVVGNVTECDIVFSTVHRAKGLEFDGVYVGNDFELDHLGRCDEETKNLLYVAFTRPKSYLVMNQSLES